MAKRFLLSQSKKRFLVIKRESVSIHSFIELLALRDGKISKMLAQLFRNLCPVKRGPHPTIIISSRYFSRSISCAIKKKWFSLSLPEILSYSPHIYQKSILAMSSFGRVTLVEWAFFTVSARAANLLVLFHCFTGGWRLKPLPHLQRSSDQAPTTSPASSGFLVPQTWHASPKSFSWDSLWLLTPSSPNTSFASWS